jgi:hypothetical protein
LRTQYDCGQGDKGWFTLFQEVEKSQPIGLYAMSHLTYSLLRHAFDFDGIAQIRRANYRYLAERLGDIAIFPKLPDGVVPLGFPVRVPNRDDIRQKLFKSGIYPPVHWALGNAVPPEFADSHRLSKEIMTLVCDQRYGQEDMRRTAELVIRGLDLP